MPRRMSTTVTFTVEAINYGPNNTSRAGQGSAASGLTIRVVRHAGSYDNLTGI
jgi:hypothetical protein